jgi:hypothetical protein
MQPPAAGQTTVEGFQLPSGEYVVAELQSVAPGSNADLEGDEEQSMRSFLSQQTAALDFAGYFFSLENRAEITGRDQVPLEDEFAEF